MKLTLKPYTPFLFWSCQINGNEFTFAITRWTMGQVERYITEYKQQNNLEK